MTSANGEQGERNENGRTHTGMIINVEHPTVPASPKPLALLVLLALGAASVHGTPSADASVDPVVEAHLVPGDPDGNYIVPGVQGGIVYARAAGTALALDAFVPAGSRGRPLTIVVHGGGYLAGSRVAHVGQLLELLSDYGLPWASVDYRLAGPARRDDAVEDVRAAVAFVRRHAEALDVDPDRLVLLGEDTGAEIALALLHGRTPGVVGIASIGGRFEPPALSRRVPGASLLFVHGDEDDEQPIAAIRDRCRPDVSSERCVRVEVAGGSHRAENWWPSQWAYKPELVRWIEALGRSPQSGVALAGSTPDARGWPRVPLPRGLHKRLTWDTAHGLTLDAWVPGSGTDRPIALLVHGGGWEAGDRVTYITPLFEPLAKAGIAWVSIDYRLTPNARHASQLDDVRRAVAFVGDHAADLGGNPARVVLVGESASGQMAALVASEPAGKSLAGVVSFYGVYDFTTMVRDAGPRSLAARLLDRHVLDEETWQQLREVSPIAHVHPEMPPLLLIHGTAESLWSQALAYTARLGEARVPFELVRLDGAPHGMENWEGRPEWEGWKDRLLRFVQSPRPPR